MNTTTTTTPLTWTTNSKGIHTSSTPVGDTLSIVRKKEIKRYVLSVNDHVAETKKGGQIAYQVLSQVKKCAERYNRTPVTQLLDAIKVAEALNAEVEIVATSKRTKCAECGMRRKVNVAGICKECEGK